MDGNSTWKSGLTALLVFAFFAGALFADAPTVGTVYVSGFNATGQVVFASFELAGGDPNVTSCHYNPRIGIAGWHLMNEYNNIHLLCYDSNADLHEAPSLDTIRVQATNANGTGESPANVTLDISPPSTCDVSAIDELSAYAYVTGTTIYYNNISAGDFNVTVDAADDDSGIYYVSFPGTVSNGDYAYSVPYLLNYNWTTSSTATFNPATATCYDNMRVNNDTTTFSVILDNTAPVIGTVSIVPSYFNGSMRYVSILSNISATASDSGSGINESTCEYYTDGSTWTAADGYTGGECYETDADTSAASEINMRVWDNVNNSDADNGTPVIVDANAPTTTPSAVIEDGSTYTDSTWTNSPYVNVTLTCDDSAENDSGCNITYYCTDLADTCTPSTVYTGPVQITTEGTSFIRFLSVDQVSNAETAVSFTIMIDTVDPTLTVESPVAEFYYNVNTVDLNLTASDATSGINTTTCWYSIDGGIAVQITDCDNTTIAGLGSQNHSLVVGVNDSAGNEQTVSFNFYVDLVDPTVGDVTIDPIYDNGTANWTAAAADLSAPVNETLDGAGSVINTTSCLYTLDGGTTWVAASYDSGTCYADGVDTSAATSINFNVSDLAGNTGVGSAIDVLIDSTAPTTNATGTDSAGNAYTFGTWTNESVLVNLTCTDADSGCDTTYYCVDEANTCTPNETYSAEFLVSPGVTSTWYVRFNSIDNVGNEDPEDTKTMMFDMTQPTVTIQSPTSSIYNTNTTDLNYTSEDADSGVDSCWYEVNGGANSTPSATCDNDTIADLPEGNNTVIVYSNDTVGNIGSASVILFVDTIAPTVGAITVVPLYNDGSINWISGLSAISAPVSDGGSGLNTTTCMFTKNSSYAWYVDGSAYNGSHCVFTNVNTSASVIGGVVDINVGVYDLAGNAGLGTEVNVTPDETAPATVAAGVDSAGNAYTFGTWTNESVLVNLTCTDAEAGCNITYYCVDEANTCTPNETYSSAFLVSPGVTSTWYVRFNSIDNVGNEEAENNETMMFDMTPPTVTIQSPTSRLYNTNTTDLNYTSEDTDSGVDSCWWSDFYGGGGLINCSNTTLSDIPEGNDTVRVYSNDSVGNVAYTDVSFYVDTIAPTVGAITVVPLYNDGSVNWISGLSAISAPVSDGGSGLNTTTCYYTKNASSVHWFGNPSAYNGSHCVFTDVNTSASVFAGVESINIQVDDLAGNTGSGTPVNVTPDETAPATVAAGVDSAGNAYTFGTWTNESVLVNLTCTDAESGCNITYYCVDEADSCTPNETYSGAFLVSPGVTSTWYARFNSIDNMGNEEVVNSETMMFDFTVPHVSIQSPTSTMYTTNTTDLNYSSADVDSGVASCWYEVDGGANSTPSAACDNTTLADLAEGNHTVIVYSNDSVGNIGSASVGFYVDTIRPTVGTVTVTPLYNNGGINWITGLSAISAPVSDGGSGINTTTCMYATNTSYGWYIIPSAYNGSHCVFTDVNTSASVTGGVKDINVAVYDLAQNLGFGTPVNVTPDEGAPTTTATAVDVLGNPYTFATWTNDSVTVNLTCVDSRSGCNRTMYGLYYGTSCIDIERNYTAPVVVGGEGVIAICFYSVDQLGNTEANSTEQIWKDMSAPSITLDSPTATVYGAAAIDLDYSVADTLSGVDTCWYDIDGGSTTELEDCDNTTISGLAEGSHNVTVYVNDSVNNINSSTVTFTVDLTAPTTNASAGTYTFGTWTNRSVSVNLTCADTGGAACDKTLYCTDTTNTCTPTSTYGAASVDAVSISTEGTSYIRYRSNDTVSNMETTKSSTIMIDTTAPSTAASAVMGNGSAYTFGTWAFWNATVTLNCTDASSGCNRTLYCVDTTNNCTPSTTYTAPVLIDDEGTNYIRYYSTDNVSNTESTKNQTVSVYLAPMLAFTSNPELYTPNRANYFEISYLAMNRSTARLTVDNTNYTMTCNDTHCWATVTSRKGLHTYKAWMIDTSSRTGNTSTYNFTVDYTPPRAYYTSLTVRNGGTVGATGFFQVRYYEINLKNGTVYLNDTTANTTSSYGMTCETGGLRLCNLTLTSTDDDGFSITSGGELIIGHTYKYYVTVFDLADNSRTLKVRRFTVVGSP